MRILTWRGWTVVVLVGMVVALVTFLGLLELRQIATERQQLREIVGLIQSGRIGVGPPPPAQSQVPAEKPK